MSKTNHSSQNTRLGINVIFISLVTFSSLSCGGLASVSPLSGEYDQETELQVFSLGWLNRIMPEISPYRNRSNPLQGSVPEVDVRNKRVFVGSADHHLYCLSAISGDVIWRKNVGASVRSEPLYQRETETVFFGNDDGQLLAIDSETAEEKWLFQAEGEIVHQPIIEGEALYITSADNTVYAIDWTNGDLIWRHHQAPPSSEFEIIGFAGVAVNNRIAYTGFSDGSVVALDAFDGSVIWTRDLSEDLSSQRRVGGIPVMKDIDTTPVLGRRHLYVASYDGGIYALDRESGRIIWREPVRGVVSLVGRGTYLYAAQAGEGILSLNASTGRVRWRLSLGPATYFRPTFFRDVIIVSDSRHGLTALRDDEEQEEGYIVQRFSVGEGVGGPAAITGSTAFVLSNGGQLAALSLH